MFVCVPSLKIFFLFHFYKYTFSNEPLVNLTNTYNSLRYTAFPCKVG